MTLRSFGVEKKQKTLLLRDVVAQGPSESRRIKNVDGFLFPRAMLMLRQTARKQRLSLSMSIALGFWPCHREKAVKGTCTVTQAARDRLRLAAVA